MNLPNQWAMKTLEELGSCHIGLTYKPENVVSSDGTLVLRSSNIQQSRLVFNDNVFVNIEVPSKLIVENGDILVCVRNGSRSLIGKSAVIEQEHLTEEITFGAFMSIYRTKHHDYVRHLFHSDMYYRQIRNNLGATINQITNKNLNSFSFPFPLNSSERNQIAKILSTVDKKIDLIDQKIAETENLKTGLMQKLFSEGVGVQDSDGTWQPHSEFQDSKFGQIPSSWKTQSLKQIGDCLIGLTYKPEDTTDNSGTLVLRSSNVQNNRIELNNNVYVKCKVSESIQIKKGDILICVRNGSRSLIGKSALIGQDMRNTTFGAFMSVFRTPLSELIYQLFQTEMYRKQILKNLGATINQITNKNLYSFEFPIPPENERKEIVKILTTIDRKVDLLTKQKAETQQLKKGLMQKLLTGEWRVPLDNPEAA
ncbi:restriction endonuclease subunit S [Vibrio aestuarianus]|uniref:restriction endonuclease subunit S n=1 Tax=Vibrio aestuarianus TaxID=28171 RepID=UPI00237CA6B1|nr:restriction endonuclease subunit S [Vibrio aestuarianus]MDE1250278.1 restriction endonuclease subunit S [Vibrio aestuarianus]